MYDDNQQNQHQDNHTNNTPPPLPDPIGDTTFDPTPSFANSPDPGPAPSAPSSQPPDDGLLNVSNDDNTTKGHDAPTSGDSNQLLDIKKQVLQDLSPLVGKLEQEPEEKFRTTMMMIQASDDQSLIPSAYEAAKAISDEKVRAKALLDVVNEINYFTQQKK